MSSRTHQRGKHKWLNWRAPLHIISPDSFRCLRKKRLIQESFLLVRRLSGSVMAEVAFQLLWCPVSSSSSALLLLLCSGWWQIPQENWLGGETSTRTTRSPSLSFSSLCVFLSHTAVCRTNILAPLPTLLLLLFLLLCLPASPPLSPTTFFFPHSSPWMMFAWLMCLATWDKLEKQNKTRKA